MKLSVSFLNACSSDLCRGFRALKELRLKGELIGGAVLDVESCTGNIN